MAILNFYSKLTDEIRMVMHLWFITLLYFFSFQSFGQGEEASLVDTCNCPRLEEFSEDIHAVISKIYQDENPSDVPIEFDQLTLVMDLQTRLEDNLSCGETYGDLSEFEENITKSINNSTLITPFQNSVQYSGNISLQEFRPRFMRIASDNDRTLFFRTTINGEEKYILMYVDREGQTKVEIINSPPSMFEPTPDSPVAIALEEHQEVSPELSDFVITPSTAFSFSGVEGPSNLEVFTAPVYDPQGRLISGPPRPERGPTFTTTPEMRQGRFGELMSEGGIRATTTTQQIGVERAIETNNGDVIQVGYIATADGPTIRRPVPGDDNFDAYMEELRELGDGSDTRYLEELERRPIDPRYSPRVDSLRGVTTRTNLQYSHRFGEATRLDPNFDYELGPDSEGVGRRITLTADLLRRYDTNAELTAEERALVVDYRNGDLGTSFRLTDDGQGTPTEFQLSHGNVYGDNIMADFEIRNSLRIERPRLSFTQIPTTDNNTSKTPNPGKGSPSGDTSPNGPRPDEQFYYTVSAEGTLVDGVEEVSVDTSRQDRDTRGYINLSYNLPEDILTLDTARGDIDGTRITSLQATIGEEGTNRLALGTFRQEINPTFPLGVEGTVEHTTTLLLTDSEYISPELSYDRVVQTQQDSSDGLQSTDRRTQQGVTVSEDRVVLRFSTTNRQGFSRDTSIRQTDYEINNNNTAIRDMGIQEYASLSTYTAGELSISEDSATGTLVHQIEESDITGTTGQGFGVFAFVSDEGMAIQGSVNVYQVSASGNEAVGCGVTLRREIGSNTARAPSQFTSLSNAQNSTTCNLTILSRDDEDPIGVLDITRSVGNTDFTASFDTEDNIDIGIMTTISR
jgi:hypothetical protein